VLELDLILTPANLGHLGRNGRMAVWYARTRMARNTKNGRALGDVQAQRFRAIGL
jgi:hypothetical protein